MSLHVEVVSPEQILWQGEAEMVTARTIDGGDITFLVGHTPFLGALQTGSVTIRPEEGEDLLFAVHGGFVEVSNDVVSLISDVAEAVDAVDVDRAMAARDAAKVALGADANDPEAQAALRRAELRLSVAGAANI